MAQNYVEVKQDVITAIQTTVGINTKNIPKMQQYIEDYANAIDAKKITVAAKNVTAALKGNSQVAAVKALCQACDSYANTLTSKLRAYKSRLTDVKAAYEKNDTSSTSISSVTSSIKGSGSGLSKGVHPKVLTHNKS